MNAGGRCRRLKSSTRKETNITKVLAMGVLRLVGARDLAAVAAETGGVPKTEIVLGTHSDLSGPAAIYGVSATNAIKMRFDDVNAAGGIHGRKIRYVVEDTQYQVPRAVQAGNKLVQRRQI